jgi:peptidoglycan/LPS O-acetylase OafA/YrhL
MRPTWLHRHDYSYGTYLYGFPLQQSLIAAGIADPWLLFATAAGLTLGCAALSWHAVERPCLALKLRLTHAVSRFAFGRLRRFV